jgi:NDP-hexose C3-ketoreductase / dTDP-4-oxo-2-deoxy-alpha-D-pentos-2-ene 2,3-reductase
MQYARLGRAGVQVSRLALGTMNLGWKISAEDSTAILDHAFELGVNLLDTADVYGAAIGASEEVIGAWLAGGSSRRDGVVLATKLGNPVNDGPNSKGLSALHIRNAVEQSLRRLRTDHVDLYQLHNVDATVEAEEIWQALDQLVSSGKVVYVGTCNHGREDLGRLAAARSGSGAARLGVVSEQSRYNIADRAVEESVLPYCRDNGLGFLAYSPLQGGLLAGPQGSSAGRRQGKSVSRRREAEVDRVQTFEAICESVGRSPAVVATAWLLAKDGVTSVLSGPGSLAQLEDVVGHAEEELPADVLSQLDDLWAPAGVRV